MDLSNFVNDFRTDPVAFGYVTGYLYIGQEMPFNNLYFDMGTGNVSGNTVQVDIWYANDWHSAVDIYDGTSVTGASLCQDGRISWNTEWNKGWDIEQRANSVEGLSGVEIYDMYWARLSWSGAVSSNTTIRYIGQKFCEDNQLVTYYPDLRNTNLKTAYGGASKTDWSDQCYMATEFIIRDMKSRRLIKDPGQILDWSIFIEPACHKAAEIIYRALGQAYKPNADEANKAYTASMNKDAFRLDENANARLDIAERAHSKSNLSR